nr:class I SAM-dependent methyltransferase [Rarobacter incanus]
MTRESGRLWWDSNAQEYMDEHRAFLGDADFVWGPEGLREADARLLGDIRDLSGQKVLEIGSGAAQCSRWLAAGGCDVVATDVSATMIEQARLLNERTGVNVPLVAADARDLPFGDAAFDVVFTAYGAIPFVAELDAIHAEVARVLRPGGRWVFSVTHPIRWAFPDAPGEPGLTVSKSYFDRAPYIETDPSGNVTYAEYHRTIGDHVAALVAAGFALTGIIEPEWPTDNTNVWGGWSPLRGKVLPGTAIFQAVRPSLVE